LGVEEWFNTFCWNLRVQKEDDISYRYRAITRRLNADFWNTTSDSAHSLYVGSYGRNTAIDFSDIDMIMELPSDLYYQYNGYVTNGQSALLQAVKTSIERTYSKTSLKADGQVIQVPFTDGINYEVAPVFTNKAGSYTFPNANNGGSWQTTNPRPEIVAIRTRNAACNNNLILLCRVMRVVGSSQSTHLRIMVIHAVRWTGLKSGHLGKCRKTFGFLLAVFIPLVWILTSCTAAPARFVYFPKHPRVMAMSAVELASWGEPLR
jgi:hypothetical protein